MWSRASVTVLFLFAIVAALTMPAGNGQVLSSFTTVLTVTTPLVSTATVYSTLGTTRGASTVFHTNSYFTLVTVEGTRGAHACVYKELRFMASKGDLISLAVKTSIPISLYIMSSDDYQTWENVNSCDAPSSSLYNKQVSRIVHIDLIAPSNGDYDLVFVNISPSTPADVDVNFVSASQAVTSLSLPVVSAFAVTGTYTATTAVTTVRAVTGQSLLERYGLPVVAVILMLGIGFLMARRRSRMKQATGPLKNS